MTLSPKKLNFHFSDLLWDLWCITSIVGIWPRFIEPNLLHTTRHTLKLLNCPEALKGLKIVHFSDLHIRENFSTRNLTRLSKKIRSENPDIIVFTGDFICHSYLDDEDQGRLLTFLNELHATYGCYAVLGNHDYAEYVSINSKGEYDILHQDVKKSMIKRGFKRLFGTVKLSKKVTGSAASIGLHQGLVDLLKKSPFQVLHNESLLIKIKDSFLNICGLGEYTLAKTCPEKAFGKYDVKYPGIVLVHNPDAIPLLNDFPGDFILCGHTHGGQVNLPWMWTKFTLMENPEFKRGLVSYRERVAYVNRGVGSVMKFRWFAIPEIFVLTLE